MLLVARFVRLWLGPVNEHQGFLSGSFQVGLSSGPCLIARFCLSSESRYFLMRRCRVGGCDMIETRRDSKTKQGCFVPQKRMVIFTYYQPHGGLHCISTLVSSNNLNLLPLFHRR